jgi:hypothetical protein
MAPASANRWGCIFPVEDPYFAFCNDYLCTSVRRHLCKDYLYMSGNNDGYAAPLFLFQFFFSYGFFLLSCSRTIQRPQPLVTPAPDP